MKNSIITVVYSHGRYGSPWYGFKIETLRLIALKLGVNINSIRYPEELTVEEMENKLFKAVVDDVNVPGDLVFLSSSRGAYISTRISQKVKEYFDNESIRMDDDKVLPRRHLLGQFLIAPAFYIKPEYYPDQNPIPSLDMETTIIQGFDDKIIDPAKTIEFATKFKAELHLLKGGHRLNSQRNMLCNLFENFLKRLKEQSNTKFEKWLLSNPQKKVEPDDKK